MKGLKLPVGVNASGGAALIEGDENDEKIISIALGGGENEHAWQQDSTLGEELIFDFSDPTTRAKILRRLYSIFDLFRIKKRFMLKKETIEWEGSEEGEVVLSFKYVNLESDEEKNFRRPLVGGA